MRSAFVFVLVFLLAAAGTFLYFSTVRGFSTRDEPTGVERAVTGILRRWSVPARARDARNPVAFTGEVWTESRAHFADHCASCHGNDGGGQTEMGRNLYPRTPDMRLAATQQLTDGELYWIIENGVRLTGMPAWGAGGDHDEATWKLVHFIRRLNDLSPADIDAMKALNPKSPSELQEELDDRQFLSGGDVAEPAPAHHH